ncbi:uncharacterized protein LOC127720675 [Mytilus californianus]|uniref:uncharacterized protein LOC127720675 n=1 Tax=Mytilus californianus TaxID=6549 RepID=UPI0022450F7E|nr:uncharacterized protein LOC127720675 [Mytilus californianus]
MARMSTRKSESLLFYKYLCQKIGSEEVVRIRRLVSTIRDIEVNGKIITSGSKGEGLNLNGSDCDIMIIDQDFKVYQSETKVKRKSFPIPLTMNTEETPPCFTQLLLLHQNIKRTHHLLQKNDRGYMLSSELYKRFILKSANAKFPAPFFGKIHGPCVSDKHDTFDLAWCLKCDKWIFQAEPWISRPRTTWPSPEIISKIVSSSGVLFVPIGCKGSINELLEWRISFSEGEKFLIFSFTHTQLLCYAMLKILLKEIIEKHEDLKGLLCSYFLKTLMFWISEETDQNVWRPDNIIPCFMACLQRLLYCVRYSILSHYFIPENNLFILRFNVTNKDKLITILMNSYEQGINCFASSMTLQDYQRHSEEIPESEISRYVGSLEQPIPIFYGISCCSGSVTNSRLLYYFLHHSSTALSRVLFALQISEASLQFPEETQYPKSSGHKHLYSKYKLDLNHLIIGLHSDTLYGSLKLASFFYANKNYVDALTVIRYALTKCTNENIDTGILVFKKTCNHSQINMSILRKKEKLRAMITSLRGHPFSFGVGSSIVPQELRPDVTSTPTSFHPLPFAHFLNFLCYYHLHDISLCRQSLQRLSHLQRTLSKCGTNFVWPYFLNTIILCGIANKLMEDTDSARTAFQEAARHDKYNVSSAASRLSSVI